MQEMAEGQPRIRTRDALEPAQWDYLVALVDSLHGDLLAILREALKEADEQIESGERVKDMRCDECGEGLVPLKYEARTCWLHKARKLIGEAR